jgi:hypothetical protein
LTFGLRLRVMRSYGVLSKCSYVFRICVQTKQYASQCKLTCVRVMGVVLKKASN